MDKDKNLTKDDYIKLISRLSDRYGDKLLMLMDECDKNNLMSITFEEARNFYQKLI